MSACVCGHPAHVHDTQGCLHMRCTGSTYEPDDGTNTGTVYPKASADPYHGIYLGKKYNLEESA